MYVRFYHGLLHYFHFYLIICVIVTFNLFPLKHTMCWFLLLIFFFVAEIVQFQWNHAQSIAIELIDFDVHQRNDNYKLFHLLGTYRCYYEVLLFTAFEIFRFVSSHVSVCFTYFFLISLLSKSAECRSTSTQIWICHFSHITFQCISKQSIRWDILELHCNVCGKSSLSLSPSILLSECWSVCVCERRCSLLRCKD